MKKIIMTLDSEDISRAIQEVKLYKEDLNVKISRLIETLMEHGVEIAKLQIMLLKAVYTGDLKSSIVGYFSPATNVGIVEAGAYYAVYVEFGTGIVGKASPHPLPKGWAYDVNKHGESGWWYMSRYGRWQWTKGMVSRPFMYNTVRELERICEIVARKVFGT